MYIKNCLRVKVKNIIYLFGIDFIWWIIIYYKLLILFICIYLIRIYSFVVFSVYVGYGRCYFVYV